MMPISTEERKCAPRLFDSCRRWGVFLLRRRPGEPVRRLRTSPASHVAGTAHFSAAVSAGVRVFPEHDFIVASLMFRPTRDVPAHSKQRRLSVATTLP